MAGEPAFMYSTHAAIRQVKVNHFAETLMEGETTWGKMGNHGGRKSL